MPAPTRARCVTRRVRSDGGGTSDFAFGIAGDGDSPLADVDGTYCMLPLISRNTVRGILYVDRPPAPEIGETQLRMLLDFAAQAAIAMENARLYCETKRLLEETQRLASTDPLTGPREPPSAHRAARPRAAQRRALRRAARLLGLRPGRPQGDQRQPGHAAGDEALRDFAEIVRSNARRGDIAARIGGRRVRAGDGPDRPHRRGGRPAPALRRPGAARAASSAGVALFPRHGADAETLFAAADRALYEAKQAGKNRFRFAPEPA